MKTYRAAFLGLVSGATMLVATNAWAGGDLAPERPFSWSGFYLGLHAGTAWSDTDWSFFNGIATTEAFGQSSSSMIVGGQAGLQGQWGNWVAGIEVSYSPGVRLSETSKALLVADRTRTSEINDLLLATVRLGYATDRWLAYAKGGYANAEVEFRSNVASTGALTSSSNDRESGWTLGAGFEYAIARNLSLGLEYNFVHLDMGDRTQTNTPGFCPAPCTVTAAESDIQTIMARLNVRLGGY